MNAQKSAVPVAPGHDAHRKLTQMNSTKNLATNTAAVKLSIAEKMRVHREYYEGLNEIGRIYANKKIRTHNTADNGRPPKNDNGSRTYLMSSKPKHDAPPAPSIDDTNCELTALVVRLVQSASYHRPNGYYSIQWAGDYVASIRWEGYWKTEIVALVQFDHQRTLFLDSVVHAHPSLVHAFKLICFQTCIVKSFINPVCPTCGGSGATWAAGYRGVEDCPTCGGGGLL